MTQLFTETQFFPVIFHLSVYNQVKDMMEYDSAKYFDFINVVDIIYG